MVTSDNYNVSRFFSTDFDRALIEVLKNEEFDIIQLESLFMTPYIGTIRRISKAKIVLLSHNLEYIIWKRLANATSNRAKRVYLNYLAKQLKQYEVNVIKEVDGIAAISNGDALRYEDFKSDIKLQTIPFGIDIEDYQPTLSAVNNEASLFHLGAMDWKPNIEGVMWFAEEVYPSLKGFNLHLAGRKMPDWFTESIDSTIHNHGEVIDALTFMDQFPIMIVPLFSAGGMRVKIIEGMALGLVVISTKVGGIPYLIEEDINGVLIDSNDHLGLANSLKMLLFDDNRCKEIAINGRKKARSFDWDFIKKDWEKLLSKNN